MTDPSEPPSSGPASRRGLERTSLSPQVKALNRYWLVIAVLVAVAVVMGYVSATRQPPPVFVSQAAAPSASGRALGYLELRSAYRGPNADLYRGALVSMKQRPALTATVPPQSAEDTERALSARAQRRAYEGAPPTIPHEIAQQEAPACLSCHADGLRLQDKVAPPMSHEPLASCTQCHVVRNDPRGDAMAPPSAASLPSENSFSGLAAERGHRAWPGAPPTIPHATLMRRECLSCHGVWGRLGLRSTHPWRQSCTQCHVPSAELDQRSPIAELGQLVRRP